MSSKNPLWISFDCYGTLIDWETGVRRSFREIVRAGDEEQAELFRTWERIQWEKIQSRYTPYSVIMRESFRETLDHLGYDCAAHAADSFVNSLARWEPFPDVNPALMQLAKR